jgi:hypothetical protein
MLLGPPKWRATTLSDTADIKKRLDEKSTAELQDAIRKRHLTEQAYAIARAILKERDAPVPKPISEEVLEEHDRKIRSNSNRNFVLTIIVLCIWAAYGYLTGLFVGEQKRLNQSMLITFLFIASIWGWDWFGMKK